MDSHQQTATEIIEKADHAQRLLAAVERVKSCDQGSWETRPGAGMRASVISSSRSNEFYFKIIHF
jgi:hypothetical protein